MRNTILGIFTVVAVAALSPFAASTTVVNLKGTYSQSTVATDCKAAGGTFYGGGGGSPYGCLGPQGGGSVECNAKTHKCTGYIPRTTGPSHPTLGGIFGGARENAPAGGTVSSKAGSKPANETPVQGGTERGGRKH